MNTTLAFYATKHPAPGQSYQAIKTPAGLVYLRVVEVEDLDQAASIEQRDEVLLNTVDTEDL